MADQEVLIRPYQPKDRPAAMSLADRLCVGVAPWRAPDAVREAVTGWVRGSLDGAGSDDRAVIVADVAGQLVGLVTVGERRHFTGEVDAYVGELIVAEDAERRGVGTRLMAAAEEWGRRRGLRHLTLETGSANRIARAFYASLGYLDEDVRLTKDLNAT